MTHADNLSLFKLKLLQSKRNLIYNISDSLITTYHKLGNLPNKITRDEVLKVIVKVLGQGCVTDLRLSLDENMRPRGFGYVELKDESMVDRAIEELSGMEIGKIYRTACAGDIS